MLDLYVCNVRGMTYSIYERLQRENWREREMQREHGQNILIFVNYDVILEKAKLIFCAMFCCSIGLEGVPKETFKWIKERKVPQMFYTEFVKAFYYTCVSSQSYLFKQVYPPPQVTISSVIKNHFCFVLKMLYEI